MGIRYYCAGNSFSAVSAQLVLFAWYFCSMGSQICNQDHPNSNWHFLPDFQIGQNQKDAHLVASILSRNGFGVAYFREIMGFVHVKYHSNSIQVSIWLILYVPKFLRYHSRNRSEINSDSYNVRTVLLVPLWFYSYFVTLFENAFLESLWNRSVSDLRGIWNNHGLSGKSPYRSSMIQLEQLNAARLRKPFIS